MKKILKMKGVGKRHYKQPDVELTAEMLTIERGTWNGDSAFNVCYHGRKIMSIALNLSNYDLENGIVNKNALNNAISYKIVEYKNHTWGGYMKVEVEKPDTKKERQMKIARDWGAFMELRKDQKLNLTDDEYWITKIIEHNPIKKTFDIIGVLSGNYTYEQVDEFICDFSKMHSEVYEIIKEEK